MYPVSHIIVHAMHKVHTKSFYVQRERGEVRGGDEEVKKALVIALFMLVMVIVSLLIARFQL